MEKVWIAGGVVFLFGLAVWLLYRSFRRANPWGRTPYKRQESILTPAEKAFYDVLTRLAGEEIAICPKPSVREVLRVRPDVRRDRQKYFNWISQKHVDFVLCDRQTMHILCAVELDDRSHDRRDRRQRDAFLDKAFRKARLPLFHVPCRKSYGEAELAELMDFLCDGRRWELPDWEQEDTEELPLCPDCGFNGAADRFEGPHAGEAFYGCPNFPDCRRTRPLH